MKNFIEVFFAESTVKTFDSLLARSHNLFRGRLKDNIFFLHIQKCGGSSINQAIKSCYQTLNITQDRYLSHLDSEAAFKAVQMSGGQTNLSAGTINDYPILQFRENLLLYYMSQQRIRYIAGHFSFSATAYQHFFEKYAFVTVLRDPVERWISAYFYNRYKKAGDRKLDADFTAYLDSELGRSRGYTCVKLLGGANPAGDYTSEQAITRAKDNLQKFTVVGCLEYQEDFVRQFEQQFGRKLKIRSTNQSPKSKAYRRSLITEEIEEKIREICKPDVEVYQYAVDNFVQR